MIKVFYRLYQQTLRLASYFMKFPEPKLFVNHDSSKEVLNILKIENLNKPLIVTDKNVSNLEPFKTLLSTLNNNGISFMLINDVMPNPAIEHILNGYKVYKENECDGIIAVGGGSVIDYAKVIGAKSKKPNKPIQKMRGLLKIGKKLPPFIAIPTTAGTGSEATLAAVVTDGNKKYAINDPVLIPKYAILDYTYTLSCPKPITASTGMDALTHAIEAYIGKSNTKKTKAYAVKAIKIILTTLKEACDNPGNKDAREQMLLASYYAGLSFTRAYVGYVHAIAHALGGMYHVPHGLANAILLPYVLKYYGNSLDKAFSSLFDSLSLDPSLALESNKTSAIIEMIKQLNSYLNIPSSFDCIKEEDIDILSSNAIKEANPLYPVPKILSKEDIVKIIKDVKA